MSEALRNAMEVIESIVWFSAGMIPTLAALEIVWRLSKGMPILKGLPLGEGRREVKTAYA